MGWWDWGAANVVPDPAAPSVILPTRQAKEAKYRTPDGHMRTIRFLDQYSPDDVAINDAKAFLYALVNQRVYDRPRTPWKVRRSMSKVGLVF